jgi:hypothetical protein
MNHPLADPPDAKKPMARASWSSDCASLSVIGSWTGPWDVEPHVGVMLPMDPMGISSQLVLWSWLSCREQRRCQNTRFRWWSWQLRQTKRAKSYSPTRNQDLRRSGKYWFFRFWVANDDLSEMPLLESLDDSGPLDPSNVLHVLNDKMLDCPSKRRRTRPWLEGWSPASGLQ